MAGRVADDLQKRFPEDTAVNLSYLPAIRGLVALNQNNIPKSIGILQRSAVNEFIASKIYFNSFYGNLYPIYVRGLAFLASRKSSEAATEFQKIIDHPGLVAADPIGALAHLQVGRAYQIAGEKAKATAEYQKFLGLWNNADSGIPILQQAKAEFAKLQ